jgi:hypothetical protein
MTTIDAAGLASLLAEPLREKVVAIGDLKFRLREMTEEQSTQYELALQDKSGRYDWARARRAMIAMMLVDDAGNRVVQDESQLKTLPRSIAGRLFDECQSLNRYEPNEVRDLIKNCDAADD